MLKMEARGTFTEYLPSYTIGVDAYRSVAQIVKRFGTKAAVIGGPTAMSVVRSKLEAALVDSDIHIASWHDYGRNSTHANACRLAQNSEVIEADMLFLVGGGRAIDEGKEIATLANKPYFCFPTLASNCASVTRIGVFYKDDDSADDYFIPAQLPVHTFIDTQIIVESPDEFFWAGIGDAFSKGPEVELTTRDVDLLHSPLMGRALATGACTKPLFADAEQALKDKRAGIVSEAFEAVVLNIIITAGIISNMTTNMRAEKGTYYFNSSVAHAFYNAFTLLGERAKKHLHGEVVAFGTCVLFAFDGNINALKEQVALNKKLGLPIRLSDLDITDDTEENDLKIILQAAQKTNEWGRAPYGYTEQRFYQAIKDTDLYGKAVALHQAEKQEVILQQILDHAPSAETAVSRKM